MRVGCRWQNVQVRHSDPGYLFKFFREREVRRQAFLMEELASREDYFVLYDIRADWDWSVEMEKLSIWGAMGCLYEVLEKTREAYFRA